MLTLWQVKIYFRTIKNCLIDSIILYYFCQLEQFEVKIVQFLKGYGNFGPMN